MEDIFIKLPGDSPNVAEIILFLFNYFSEIFIFYYGERRTCKWVATILVEVLIGFLLCTLFVSLGAS